ncbi:MAG TPA: tyrosine--tRNA ligase [Candidatus Paceibacterota bacterium]|nr:tyrosine--tRNA ligase [Candidatus Paceibacterota bacterium]
MKVITDEKKIDALLERGVENIFIKEELKKKLLSGKKLKIYLGIDPTGPTLHLGHAIPIKKLKEFQDLGHQVILLMGDFTAMIGDPTDKMAARKQLTRKEVLNNLRKYKKQASVFLNFSGSNKAQFKFNSKWLSKLNFGDVVELASKMTVDQMLKRDMFVRRMEENKPIFIHEFMYPLMQGYDSVAMEVDVEIGGNDQTFNMLTGRHLEAQILGKDKSVLATKLLEDNSGKKMGKTEGNMVTLEDLPNDMFGKIMSWNDSLILKGFELCTDVSLEAIKQYKKEISSGANPRDFKIKLAHEMVKIYHGEQKAKEAEENFIKTFQKKEIPDEIEEIIDKGELGTVLVSRKIVKSMSEFRRLIDEGAVKKIKEDNTEEKITDYKHEVSSGDIYKVGKRRFIKIK